jgi:hypothetical protein
MLEEKPSVDITRARIVTQTHRERAGEPLVSVWGHVMYRLFSELPVDIAPGELIVGSPVDRSTKNIDRESHAWL